MAVLYTIRDWDKRFEKAQSRQIDGPLPWVAIPTKHDGLGFRRIMALEDGMAVYAAWVLIAQIAAKCPKRGTLADENGPLDSTDFAIKTGARKEAFDRALSVLCSNKIGWILSADCEPTNTRPALQDSTGQDNTKDCGEPASTRTSPPHSSEAKFDPSSVAFPDFPCAIGKRSTARTWRSSDALMAELAAAFPAVDVYAEIRRAHSWVKSNLERRKTASGMPGFVHRWMTRAQNSGGTGVRAGSTARANTEPEYRKLTPPGRKP